MGAHGSHKRTVRPDWDWQRLAACQGEDLDLFFPVGTTGPAEVQIEQAKQVCGPCPVRSRCLDHALAVPEKGIWGGLDEEERKTERRRRSRRAAIARERVASTDATGEGMEAAS